MKIDSTLLDTLSAQAKANPRLRQACLSGELWNQGIRNLGRILLGRWHNTKCLESGTVKTQLAKFGDYKNHYDSTIDYLVRVADNEI